MILYARFLKKEGDMWIVDIGLEYDIEVVVSPEDPSEIWSGPSYAHKTLLKSMKEAEDISLSDRVASDIPKRIRYEIFKMIFTREKI